MRAGLRVAVGPAWRGFPLHAEAAAGVDARLVLEIDLARRLAAFVRREVASVLELPMA
jgi:hypothetical protein